MGKLTESLILNRSMCICRDRLIGGWTNGQMEKEIERCTYKWVDGWIDIQADRKKDREEAYAGNL
jgi:hypothetical protein